MQPEDANVDEALLREARLGNSEAHAALYRAFAPMVYTLALRMLGTRAAAEDVLQDSFVEVIRKSAEFRGDGSIGGWIKRIAINKCLSYLRSPWIVRRTSNPGAADCVTDLASPAEVRADDAGRALARQQEVESALNVLSATARAVVWLHAVEGYTHEEIGRLMGRSTSFSKSQLARAYGELRQLLQPDESEPKTEEAEPCLGVLKTV